MNIKQQLIKIKPENRKKILQFGWCLFPNKRIQCIKFIKKGYKIRNEEIAIIKPDVWREALIDLSKYNKKFLYLCTNFFTTSIKIEKKSKIKLEKNDPIVICIVKNDLDRMKIFLSHYRKLGIKKFAILDDKSDDGTYEMLLNQPDVELFSSNLNYSTDVRQVWINRIIAHYGFGKWYLVVDSDELFIYKKCELYNINKLIEEFTEKNIFMTRSLMLDMYPKDDSILKERIEPEQIIKNYCYFDKTGYEKLNSLWFDGICGGYRKRRFNNSPYLIKMPLVLVSEGMILCNSHYIYPFKLNFGVECNSALLHYKFIPGDVERYEERIKKKNFQGGSHEYIKYIEELKNGDFKTNLKENISQKFINSNSLDDISEIKNIYWSNKE